MNDLDWCINYLKKINKIDYEIDLPKELAFRALENITFPTNLSEEFYLRQDRVLQEILANKEITDVLALNPIFENICLYKGDITLIKSDAIVNACNEKLLGCFQPLHNCIDNAIHSFAGLQVRRDLIRVMEKQGHDEPSGRVKATRGYNLPSKYIFHTVGPIANGNPSKQNEEDLYNCYRSCLRLASEYNLQSIAFCSISTGLYGYPIEEACKVALKAARDNDNKDIKIVFNVFSEEDYNVYYREIEKNFR